MRVLCTILEKSFRATRSGLLKNFNIPQTVCAFTRPNTQSPVLSTPLAWQPALVLKDTDWSYSDSLSQLEEDLTTISNQCKVDEMKKVTILIEKSLKREMSELVELTLANQTPKMWDIMLDSFQTAVRKWTELYLKKTQSTISLIWASFIARLLIPSGLFNIAQVSAVRRKRTPRR